MKGAHRGGRGHGGSGSRTASQNQLTKTGRGAQARRWERAPQGRITGSQQVLPQGSFVPGTL